MRRLTMAVFTLCILIGLSGISTLTPTPAVARPQASTPAGLVLWNSLDSTAAVTSSLVGPGFGIHEPQQVSFVPGYLGSALATYGGEVGGGGYLTMSPTSFFGPDHTRGAVEAWVQKRIPQALPFRTPLVGIFGWQPYGSEAVPIAAYWSDGYTGGPGMEFRIYDADTNQYTADDAGWDAVPVGQWTHMAFVWDLGGIAGSSDRMRIYRNGALVANNRTPIPSLLSSTDEVRVLGHHAYSRLGRPMAYLDELKVWSYAKTDFSSIPEQIGTIRDTFNRPDGGLGSSWSGPEGLGGYTIRNQQLMLLGGGPIYWQRQSFGASQEVFVTLAAVDPSGREQDLLLKVQGSPPDWRKGVIEVLYDAAARAVRVETLRPGAADWTRYANIAVTLRSGDRLGARALAGGTVTIYRNGMPLTTVTLTAQDQTFFNARGGRIGLWFIGASRARLDDFGGGQP